jgi:hypothetical protein
VAGKMIAMATMKIISSKEVQYQQQVGVDWKQVNALNRWHCKEATHFWNKKE